MLKAMPLSDQAIRRRARRFLLREPFELFVPTLPGLETITEVELVWLGYDTIRTRGGVSFKGDLAAVYRVNLALRSGNRVLLRLGDFLAQNYPMLYNRARSINWEAVLGKSPSVSVSVSSSKSRLRHMRHIQNVVYEAITHRLNRLGLEVRRLDAGDATVMVRLHRDRCSLSLDTTGTHLHKRGYRLVASLAPLRETTAAAILLAAGSDEYDLVVDPFSGSGTFLIEAERFARHTPPGIDRHFAIERSPLHSAGKLRHQRRMLQQCETRCDQRILGFDVSLEAVAQATEAIALAECDHVSISQSDARSLNFESLAQGARRRLVVSNLPYGKRLSSEPAAKRLIDQFSETLALTAKGWDYALVTPESIPLVNPALATRRELSFRNGGIPVVASIGSVRN